MVYQIPPSQLAQMNPIQPLGVTPALTAPFGPQPQQQIGAMNGQPTSFPQHNDQGWPGPGYQEIDWANLYAQGYKPPQRFPQQPQRMLFQQGAQPQQQAAQPQQQAAQPQQQPQFQQQLRAVQQAQNQQWGNQQWGGGNALDFGGMGQQFNLPGAMNAPSVSNSPYSPMANASMYGSDLDYFSSLNSVMASMLNANTMAGAQQNSAYFPAQASMHNSGLNATANMYGSDRQLQALLAQLPWNFAGQQLAANTQNNAAGMGMLGNIYGGYYPAQASMYAANQNAGLGQYQADAGLLGQLASIFGNLGMTGMQTGAQRYGDELGYAGGLANIMGQQNIAGMQTGAQGYGNELGFLSTLAQIMGQQNIAGTESGTQRYLGDLGLAGTLAGIGGNVDIANIQSETQRYLGDQSTDLGMYQTGMETGTQRYLGDLQLQQALAAILGQQGIAQTEAGTQRYLGDLGANTQRYLGDQSTDLGYYQAGTAADTQRYLGDQSTGLGYYEAGTQSDLGRYQSDNALQQAYLSAMIPAQSAQTLAAMEAQQRSASLQQMLGIIAPLLSQFGQSPAMPSFTTNYGAGLTAS